MLIVFIIMSCTLSVSTVIKYLQNQIHDSGPCSLLSCHLDLFYMLDLFSCIFSCTTNFSPQFKLEGT
jgi:hypothetical protein